MNSRYEKYERIGRQGAEVFFGLIWVVGMGGLFCIFFGWWVGSFLEVFFGRAPLGFWYPSSSIPTALAYAWMVAFPIFLVTSAVTWLVYQLVGVGLLLCEVVAWLRHRFA